MFHKLLGMAGRALKPTLMNDDRNFAVQHLWSDAMFVRDVLQLGELAPHKLLKLAVFANLYRSPDLMFHCLERYEQRRGKGVIQKVLSAGA
jgi:hypothetical protein